MISKPPADQSKRQAKTTPRHDAPIRPPVPPLPNYSLSTVCPACGMPTYRHACKVRCNQCGFMWDCSEL